MTIAAVVLAAGAGSRFGGRKLLATIHGRSLVGHVVDAARAAGLDPIVVVEPPGGAFDALDLGEVRRVVNPSPSEGLASSVRLGLLALEHETGVDAAVILAGDQPLVRPEVIRSLVTAAASHPDSPFVVPRYADDGAPNPILAGRSMWRLADELAGDRGFGPVLAEHPHLVVSVAVEGANPDVDTGADLAAVLEWAWGDRVRANRDQVDRVREVPDPADFYAPVSQLFRADPTRTDDPVLDVLRGIAQADDVWLDIGAGAGRFALPLAQIVREVIAVEPSDGMRAALEAIAAEHGIANVRTIGARWPLPPTVVSPVADVSLIAHVGYDIEAIVPFIAAMETATRRVCVALMMERQPSSIADVFWPPVHGESRVSLPALPELLELIRARGGEPAVTTALRTPRRFATRDELEGYLRGQLWIAPGGEKDARFRESLAALVDDRPDGFGLVGQQPLPVGVVTWRPPGGNQPAASAATSSSA
ncbi:MAG: NTP transferase domain-containing protein [Chloroflexi bacterium]|nr:NTP transferase domain-containing protein [Chloroflexota bacterium]